MAWKLSSKDAKLNPSDWVGFVEKGVRFEGRLDFKGTFRLNAAFKGNVRTEDTLILGESAEAEGQIDANVVIVAGRFDGVVFARTRLEIQPKGIVTGEVHTPCLVIEPGGIFDGRCMMLNAAESAQSIAIPIRSSTPSFSEGS